MRTIKKDVCRESMRNGDKVMVKVGIADCPLVERDDLDAIGNWMIDRYGAGRTLALINSCIHVFEMGIVRDANGLTAEGCVQLLIDQKNASLEQAQFAVNTFDGSMKELVKRFKLEI